MKGIGFMMFISLLLFGCNNQRKGGAESVQQPIPGFYDFAHTKNLYLYQNDLSVVPDFRKNSKEGTATLNNIDSATFQTIYQDSSGHFFKPDEMMAGSVYYGYIDTFPGFNLVCVLTALGGDGGNGYDILTFSKQGKLVSHLESGAIQGADESAWSFDKSAVIRHDSIIVTLHNCRFAIPESDSLTKNRNWQCDSIVSYHRVSGDGKIVLIRTDSVLNPLLNVVRNMKGE